jgi:imidazole glycerol-phosphate synthase subunit HisH
MIVIVDYGMGNLGSVLNMLKRLGKRAVISSDLGELAEAERLILPGVGSFDNGMKKLKDMGFVDLLNKKVILEKTPILGICLGAQLLTRNSEEGILPGLGWIDAKTVRFCIPFSNNHLRIPHMGWNEITIKRDNALFFGFEDQPRFYFAHSYHLECNNSLDVIATASYGIEFAAAVNRENIWGTQFHPEKSHKFGLRVIKNFCSLFPPDKNKH